MEKEKIKQLEVTIATPEDARQIKEVSYQSWLATYPNEEAGITLDDIQDRLSDALSDEKIAKKIEQIAQASVDERYLVVKEDGRVVGFCHAKKYPDKNQLHAIYVLPGYEGRGIGTKLWAEVKKFFDADKETLVEVAAYNANAINFYRKMGFKGTGKVFKDERLKMKSGAIIPQTEMVIATEETN